MSEQNTEQRRFSLRLTERALNQIRLRADTLQMSVNRYLLYAAEQEMKQAGEASL